MTEQHHADEARIKYIIHPKIQQLDTMKIKPQKKNFKWTSVHLLTGKKKVRYAKRQVIDLKTSQNNRHVKGSILCLKFLTKPQYDDLMGYES